MTRTAPIKRPCTVGNAAGIQLFSDQRLHIVRDKAIEKHHGFGAAHTNPPTLREIDQPRPTITNRFDTQTSLFTSA